MDFARYAAPILVAVLQGLVFLWLRKRAATEEARIEAGCTTFPPILELRILMSIAAIVLVALVVLSCLSLRRPEQRWVPYIFLGFLALVPFGYPPALTLEVDGIGSRNWFGYEKKIRWEEVASLHYNIGNRQFTVRGIDGCKITHAFNADGAMFRNEIQKRTRLSMKVARPGIWNEVQYEEIDVVHLDQRP